MSNRLPVLAAEIRRAHADVQEAARTAAERAIAAGHMLIEARELVRHGEWLQWLRDNCALAERTAQLYMQIARKGVKSAIVADLGLKAAAEAIHLEYGWRRPLFDDAEPQRRQWYVFALFLRVYLGNPVWWVFDHIDWLGRHDFASPDEWLGEPGRKWAATWTSTAGGDELLARWQTFRDERAHLTLADIEVELTSLAESDPEPRPPKARRRRGARQR